MAKQLLTPLRLIARMNHRRRSNIFGGGGGGGRALVVRLKLQRG